jgi:hypothetical protein
VNHVRICEGYRGRVSRPRVETTNLYAEAGRPIVAIFQAIREAIGGRASRQACLIFHKFPKLLAAFQG